MRKEAESLINGEFQKLRDMFEEIQERRGWHKCETVVERWLWHKIAIKRVLKQSDIHVETSVLLALQTVSESLQELQEQQQELLKQQRLGVLVID